MTTPWHKSMTINQKRKIESLGTELEVALYKAGIVDAETMAAKRDKAARIVAKIFGSSIKDLMIFSKKYELESILTIEEVLGEES